jgi:hypothetical protein
VITPQYDRNKVTVKGADDKNVKLISKPCCTLNIPNDMLKQIKFINTASTNLKITEESINYVASNLLYSVDLKDTPRDTLIVKDFLRDINKFSEPIKF